MASDKRRTEQQLLSPLDGVPIAIKDNLHIAGCSTMAGTGYDFSAEFKTTSSVVTQLEAAGAIIIGKCNMDEAALGASTSNPFYGQCHNPAYPGMTPGGSSGGSAAAVAAGFAAASLGTDTMGSVRIPAAYCGLWGIKPTNGHISTEGLVPLSTTLDCIGPLAHNAADLKLMLQHMTDSEVSATPLHTSINGLHIGIAPPALLSENEPEVAAAFTQLLQRLSDTGCTTETTVIEPWNPGQLRRDGLILTEVEASNTLATALKHHPDAFSTSFKKLMAYGQSVSEERLATSIARIEATKAATLQCLEEHDALLLPTAPQLAFPTENKAPANQADYCALANAAGCPAVSFPIPVPIASSSESARETNGKSTRADQQASAQLIGRPGADFQLLEIATMVAELS